MAHHTTCETRNSIERFAVFITLTNNPTKEHERGVRAPENAAPPVIAAVVWGFSRRRCVGCA